MIHYRSFRNTDPPGLVEVWKETFTGRGAVLLRNASPLERFAFSKLYFDPEGLIIALDEDNDQVGFVHAGFGPNAQETGLSFSEGVTCLIGVRPAYRRQGIGAELLHRSESYLRSRGAQTLFAGAQVPFNPFYLGLYGGSNSPGFLDSDSDVKPFLERQGYRPQETCKIFQRRLDQALNVIDPRFAVLRRRYEVQVVAKTGATTWWQECILGGLDFLEFRLNDKTTGKVVAVADVWEMECFSWGWGLPAVGIRDIRVDEGQRRLGLGKFLLLHVLRAMQEQYFGLAEVQALEVNQPAINLYCSLGFEPVDVGRLYRLEKTNPAPG